MNPFQEFAFEDILRIGIAFVIIFSWIIAVVYSIWGWFLLIMSGGNEEKVKPAVNHIRHAAIGITVLLFIVFFAPMALNYFGFSFADEISANRIFETMKLLSWKIFQDAPLDTSSSNQSTLPSNFSDL